MISAVVAPAPSPCFSSIYDIDDVIVGGGGKTTLAVVAVVAERGSSILPEGIAVPVADDASIVMVWGLGLGGRAGLILDFFD